MEQMDVSKMNGDGDVILNMNEKLILCEDGQIHLSIGDK